MTLRPAAVIAVERSRSAVRGASPCGAAKWRVCLSAEALISLVRRGLQGARAVPAQDVEGGARARDVYRIVGQRAPSVQLHMHRNNDRAARAPSMCILSADTGFCIHEGAARAGRFRLHLVDGVCC